MKFGLNFGLLGRGIGGGKKNVCIVLGSDAVGAGFYHPDYGSAIPTHADNNMRFYQFTWYTNGSSDVVTIAFGDAGNEKIAQDVADLIITILGKSYDARWDDTTKSYRIPSQALVSKLVKLNDSDELCFNIGAVPDNYILYDFTVMTGDESC